MDPKMVGRNKVLPRRWRCRRFCFGHPPCCQSGKLWLEVKILHSELFPSSSAVPKLLGAMPVVTRCILCFSFFLSFPRFWRGPLSWGYGLPRFGVAPRVGDVDSHAFVMAADWPPQQQRTPAPSCRFAQRWLIAGSGIAPMPYHTTWHKRTPVCLTTMPGAAKRRKQRCCKPSTISGPQIHPAAPPVLPTVLPALLCGAN